MHIGAAGSALPDAHTGIMKDLISFPLSASMFSKYQEIDIITKILKKKNALASSIVMSSPVCRIKDDVDENTLD